MAGWPPQTSRSVEITVRTGGKRWPSAKNPKPDRLRVLQRYYATRLRKRGCRAVRARGLRRDVVQVVSAFVRAHHIGGREGRKTADIAAAQVGSDVRLSRRNGHRSIRFQRIGLLGTINQSEIVDARVFAGGFARFNE